MKKVGFDFGQNSVRIAETVDDKVVYHRSFEFPDGIVTSDAISWEALYDFMKPIVKRHRFRSKNVYLSIPDSYVYVRRLVVPYMDIKQMSTNLPYEFHDYINDDIESYFFDFGVKYVLEEKSEDGNNERELDIIAAAIRKELIEKYRTLFKRLHLNLKVAVPECIAICSFAKFIRDEEDKNDFVVLDVGNNNTSVYIVADREYDSTRTLEVGMNSIARAIAEKKNCSIKIAEKYIRSNDNVMDSQEVLDIIEGISIDVMRVLNYYSYERRDNTVETIYINGEKSIVSRLKGYLKENVQLDITPFYNVSLSKKKKEDVTDSTAAIGACISDEV